jgi:hypothetical protein
LEKDRAEARRPAARCRRGWRTSPPSISVSFSFSAGFRVLTAPSVYPAARREVATVVSDVVVAGVAASVSTLASRLRTCDIRRDPLVLLYFSAPRPSSSTSAGEPPVPRCCRASQCSSVQSPSCDLAINCKPSCAYEKTKMSLLRSPTSSS